MSKYLLIKDYKETDFSIEKGYNRLEFKDESVRYQGIDYKIADKFEKKRSMIEIFFKYAFGIVVVAVTCGAAYFCCKCIKNLLRKSDLTIILSPIEIKKTEIHVNKQENNNQKHNEIFENINEIYRQEAKQKEKKSNEKIDNSKETGEKKETTSEEENDMQNQKLRKGGDELHKESEKINEESKEINKLNQELHKKNDELLKEREKINEESKEINKLNQELHKKNDEVHKEREKINEEFDKNYEEFDKNYNDLIKIKGKIENDKDNIIANYEGNENQEIEEEEYEFKGQGSIENQRKELREVESLAPEVFESKYPNTNEILVKVKNLFTQEDFKGKNKRAYNLIKSLLIAANYEKNKSPLLTIKIPEALKKGTRKEIKKNKDAIQLNETVIKYLQKIDFKIKTETIKNKTKKTSIEL